MKQSGQANGFTFRSEMEGSNGESGAQESKTTTENDRAASHEAGEVQAEDSGRVLALEALEVKKRYPGVDALDGVSFTVEEGKLVGLLGPQRQRQNYNYAHSFGAVVSELRPGFNRGRTPGLQNQVEDLLYPRTQPPLFLDEGRRNSKLFRGIISRL